ncbi:MAG: SdpI family protein [Lachnospiraceae bacterium]
MENKKDKKMVIMMILTTIVCLLPIVYGLMVYNKLPDQIPTHWNLQGEVDGYSSRKFAVFGMPVLLAVLNLIVQVGMQIDPKHRNHSEKMRLVLAWFVPVLTLMVVPICLLAAQGVQIDVAFVISLFMGILFMLLGNYLPKCKQNYTIGYKIPWTLESEENWNKTHRLAGFIWTIGGLLIIISCFIGSEVVLFPVVFLMVVIPFVYSYALYKRGI